MKKCASCGTEQDLVAFSKNKRSPDGLQSRCKLCCKRYRDQNKIKNESKDFSQVAFLVCTKCGLTKDVVSFSPKVNSPRGFDYWCKDCRQKYSKEYRRAHIEEARAQANERTSKRVKWFQDIKRDQPCIDCGEVYEPFCMDYDHIRDKTDSVSRLVLNSAPIESILAEIAKCELVCLLCHNKRTYIRFNNDLGETRKYKPHQIRNINIINAFKNKPCSICGKQYEHYNMQIDHIDPTTKLYGVCDLKNYKEETLLLELVKCQVLCALCHRRKSITEQQNDQYSSPRPKIAKRIPAFCDEEACLKECTVCHKTKDFVYFNKQPTGRAGLSPACKDCINVAQKIKRDTMCKRESSPATQKECSHCQITKPIGDFSRRTDGGLFSWCKDCFNEYRRAKRKVKRICG